MNDEELKKQIDAGMQGLIDHIDGPTQHQLHEIRHQAINRSTRQRTWLWPLASTAALMVFAVLLIKLSDHTGDSNTQHETAVVWEDLELLANDNDPEFYQDLEFLDWLDQNDVLGNDI